MFPERAINRDLYLWLAALAAGEVDYTLPWFQLNQQLTKKTLLNFPGLQARYQRFVESLLTLRPYLTRLPPDEAAAERAIQQALRHPGTVGELPPAKSPHQPVLLWLHPSPPINTSNLVVHDDEPITQ
ncbi:MAG: hypothetical protein KAI83_16840 [Thiomargarita sp.]|nr:hypothetical protein [Thiomargarita sp.]